MNKPLCVDCGLEYKVWKTGVYVFEMFKNDSQVYRIWQADVQMCSGCHHAVVFGFAARPLVEHFEDGFEAKKRQIEQECPDMIFKCLERPKANAEAEETKV